MSVIDDLLAQSLLLDNQHVPSDVVPYDDMAYYEEYADAASVLPWESYGPEPADEGAAQSLAALCETVVAHCTAEQIADFLTDQLPQPRAAWILGCVLQLSGLDEGARFWWQYAAGAEDAPASYCLYLQNLAIGDTHAAALWEEQADLHTSRDAGLVSQGDGPAYRMVTADTSLPTVLRILSRLTQAAPPRRHTQTATAVIDFVARAVTIGYDRHPDSEIPVPGPGFARHLEMIATASAPHVTTTGGPETDHTTRTRTKGRKLPHRLATDSAAPRIPANGHPQEPRRLLVEVPADDDSARAFFKEAVAVCWAAVSAVRTGTAPDGRDKRLSYYLDRVRPRASRQPTAHAV
ncbi:hypothetical protein [Streptomyces naphthomycinicus]|uniref:hypothetical protein n=1 Tax=Streptomyces naphthomycinicus TaxID=2872625 RepID=UPI001CEDF6F3|nr:hypothetical protein [Streptomyces sp. TML10]